MSWEPGLDALAALAGWFVSDTTHDKHHDSTTLRHHSY